MSGQDWRAPESKQTAADGTKTRQTQSTEDRSLPYRDWHRSLGPGLYVNDIDQLEWRLRGGAIEPVAVLELTRIDSTGTVPPTYLSAILDRIQRRDPQARVACHVATRCGVFAFLVAWRADLSDFWIYNLSTDRGWYRLDPDRYRAWLARLPARLDLEAAGARAAAPARDQIRFTWGNE